MADVGPSTKRKRGPKQKSSGTSELPRPAPTHIPRQISYIEREHLPSPDSAPVPLERRILEHHNLLQFSVNTKEFEAREKYVKFGVLQHRTLDEDLLDVLGQRDRIESLLGPRWIAALKCTWPQYRELTVEFYSTLRYSYRKFSEPDAISFSLGRQVFEMSVPQFAVAVGFYTEEEVQRPSFAGLLRGRYVTPHPQGITEARIRSFWETIGVGEYSDRDALESQIIDPVLRYIHRILACTIVGRKSGIDKCNMIDLFCMYCMIERREANIANVLLSSMTRTRRAGKDVKLPCGPYIGRLAERLGVYDRWPRTHLTLDLPTERYRIEDLRLIGICPQEGPPRWSDYGAMSVVRQRVRPVHVSRPAPPRPRARAELTTLEYVRRRLDRQDAAIRYMLACQGFDIPDWFAPTADEDIGGQVGGAGSEAGHSRGDQGSDGSDDGEDGSNGSDDQDDGSKDEE